MAQAPFQAGGRGRLEGAARAFALPIGVGGDQLFIVLTNAATTSRR